MFKTKLGLFQSFSKRLWGSIEDGKVTVQEIASLRQFFLENLSPLLSDECIKMVADKFGEICEGMVKSEEFGKAEELERNAPKYVDAFSEISRMIQDGLEITGDFSKQSGVDIERDNPNRYFFSKFEDLIEKASNANTAEEIREEQEKAMKENEDIVAQEQSNKSNVTVLSEYYSVSANSKFKPLLDNYMGPRQDKRPHFFFFNAWSPSKQMEHTDILCLVEYGQENWRTAYVRGWIFEGDIIFLYARGGYGYIGAFKAVNYKDSGSPALIYDVDHIPQPGKPKDGPFYYTEEEAARWDIYNALTDGATRVTAVNVEPIYLDENGVGNPIAVRRRTVQPMYDKNDVTAVMQAFDKKIF